MNLGSVFFSYKKDGQEKDCRFEGNFDNEDVMVLIQYCKVEKAWEFTVQILPKGQLEMVEFYIETDQSYNENTPLFLNGYQTWTNSREFRTSEGIPGLKRIAWPIMSVYGDYPFYKSSASKLHSHTYTYVRDNSGICLWGSLTEAVGYTIFEFSGRTGFMKIRKDCRGLMIDSEYTVMSLYSDSGEEEQVFDRYFAAMKIPKPRAASCTGWTSWYNYYTGITEKIVLENLKAFEARRIPIEIFQIDDGYQRELGDWLDVNDKFPSGMKAVADEIKQAGYKPGIWLAPFVCDKSSKLYREHRDLVLGKAGFNPGWHGFFYVLDFYNEGFRSYLREVFRTILDIWGYEMVKLDFLYAAALIPRRDKTRGQIMHEAMVFLRELVGEKLILGCGVPLGSAFGLVDYCRIGSDVSLMWEDKVLNHLHYRERVSTRNAIDSTMGRRHLNHRAFVNDPDVFILRSTNNKLTNEQKYTLLLFNLIFGGLVFTSDAIDKYQKEELELYRSIFPLARNHIKSVSEREGGVIEVQFTIEDNQYVMLSNLHKHGLEHKLGASGYFCRSKGFLKARETLLLRAWESILLIESDGSDARLLQSKNLFFL